MTFLTSFSTSFSAFSFSSFFSMRGSERWKTFLWYTVYVYLALLLLTSPTTATASITKGNVKPIAICLIGNRGNPESMESVYRYLIQPLEPLSDVFVHVGYRSEQSHYNLSLFTSTLHARQVWAEPHPSLSNLTQALDQSPAGRFYRFQTKGNTLSPAFGRPGGALFQYFNQARCLQMIRKAEESPERAGVRYERVIWSRADFYWLHAHPPLRLLNLSHLWIPLTEYYHGINDRHAVCNRTAAEIYLGRWDALLSGAAVPALTSPLARNGPGGRVDSEAFLNSYLRLHRVPVAAFPSVAALACCPVKRTCYTAICLALPDPFHHHTFSFKYCSEGLLAFGNALNLRRENGNWSMFFNTPYQIIRCKSGHKGGGGRAGGRRRG